MAAIPSLVRTCCRDHRGRSILDRSSLRTTGCETERLDVQTLFPNQRLAGRCCLPRGNRWTGSAADVDRGISPDYPLKLALRSPYAMSVLVGTSAYHADAQAALIGRDLSYSSSDCAGSSTHNVYTPSAVPNGM